MDPVVIPVAIGAYALYRWNQNRMDRKYKEMCARLRAADLAAGRHRCVIWDEGAVTHNLWVSASCYMREDRWQAVLAVLPSIGEVRETGELPHFEEYEAKQRSLLWVNHVMFRVEGGEKSRAVVGDWINPKKFVRQYRK
jgi:hypothetical protein